MTKTLSIYVCFASLQADYAFVLIQRYLQIQVSTKRGDRMFVNLHEDETVRSTMSQLDKIRLRMLQSNVSNV